MEADRETEQTVREGYRMHAHTHIHTHTHTHTQKHRNTLLQEPILEISKKGLGSDWVDS